MYSVNGLTVATAATDAHCVCEIWNPSTARIIKLKEFSIFVIAAPGAGAGFVLRRSSAKGTPGSTVTPTIEHHVRRNHAPDSAFTLELAAFTVQPTLIAGELGPPFVFPAVTASGIVVPIASPWGIEIPPGTGLCVVNRAAIVVPAAEVGVLVEEEIV